MRRATHAELIVPIRDRRRRRRILTVRNFRNAFFVMLALVAGITIEAHLRNSRTTDDFGRLYAAKLQPAPELQKKSEVVEEAPIADANAADPTLIVAQARAQILTGESDPKPLPAESGVQQQAPLVGHDSAGHLVVVGGPEGVQIVQSNAAKPVLGGGFGRR